LSLYFDGGEGEKETEEEGSSLWFANHDKRTLIDAMRSQQQQGSDEASSKSYTAEMMLSSDVEQVDLGARDTSFRRACCFGVPLSGTVGPWRDCAVYHGQGVVRSQRAVLSSHAPLEPPAKTLSFEEYEECKLAQGLSAIPDDGSSEEEVVQVETNERKMTAKAWLAQSFPITATQLKAIIDIVAPANPHLEHLQRFLEGWLEKEREDGVQGLFPVQVQVPIMLSVYGIATIQSFEACQPSEEHFKVPREYEMMSLEEAMESMWLDADAEEAAEGADGVE